jgi:superfamily II DNA or RNA helicase
MLKKTIVRYGDLHVSVSPAWPAALEKELTYQHKSLEVEEGGWRRKSKKTTVKLYNLDQSEERGKELSTLPGFASVVKGALAKMDVEHRDERSPRPEPVGAGAAAKLLRPYQMDCLAAALWAGGGVISCVTGWGKCLSPDTPVIFADGTVKTIGEVETGDQLMGDDSTPRTVLERVEGFGPMYRLTPIYGDPVEIADHHILSLVKSGDCERDKYPDGHVVDITVDDYLRQSNVFRHRYKLYKAAVDFPAKSVAVDPYFMGMWIGNGTWSRTEVTTPFQEVADYLETLAGTLGLRRMEYACRPTEDCMRFAIVGSDGRNTLMDAMRGYGLMAEKKKVIPRDYLVNSKEARLQFLAGMLDADGHYDQNGKFDWCSVDKDVARDFTFLARSLGFRATENISRVCGYGKTVTRYRVFLSGDLHKIPTKVRKKRAAVRTGVKDVLRCGFKLERIADGPYVGVRLDGNMRHILGDFTVTHNTHVMGAIIRSYPREELLRARMAPGTVVVTPTKDIAEKNAADLREMLPEREVGLLHSDCQKPSDDITVCVAGSMENLPLGDCGLLIYDEVHTVTWNKALVVLSAPRALRYGLSATPTGRFDNADKVITGVFGPIIYSRTYADAVGDGAVVPLEVLWLDAPEPPGWRVETEDKVRAYRRGVWCNQPFNELVGRVMGRIPANMQALCVVDKISHMDNLIPLIPGCAAVHAETSQKALAEKGFANTPAVTARRRKELYQEIKDGQASRVLSTGIYRAGVSFNALSVLVNAEGLGSEIIAGQLPGRASRVSEGKSKAWIVDFKHKWDEDYRGGYGFLRRDDMCREAVYRRIGFAQREVTEHEFHSAF